VTEHEIVERCQAKLKLIEEWEKEIDSLKEQQKDIKARADGALNEIRALLKGAGPQQSLGFDAPPPRDTVIAADLNCPQCGGSGTIGENYERETCPCLVAALDRARAAGTVEPKEEEEPVATE
jgi:hypothetical protein